MTLAQELERFRKDALYVDEHREELTARYPDRWIAVFEERVVADARSPKELRAKLLKKNVPPGEAYHAYLPTQEEDLLILLA